jgi:biofilm PGA synthesis N-glycosyltransferase PgaC
MYFPVKSKLVISVVFAVCWFSFSFYFALPWARDLSDLSNPFIAWFIVIGLALIPGIALAFLVASLVLDSRPDYKIPDVLPSVSILIAAFNEEKFIVETLDSICKQAYPGAVEILIIDDCSVDDTYREVEAFSRQYNGPFNIKIERMPVNGGKALALNHGLRVCRHEVIVTIDADTLLFRDSLQHLIANLVLGPPNTAAVAGTILVRNSRDSFITRMQEWDYFHGISVIKRTQSLFQGALVAQGAFSAYRKDAIEELGGWTDVVGEDIVLTWGFRENGYRVGYAENAFAFTEVPDTYAGFFRQRRRWSRGLIEAFLKHPKVITEIKLNSLFIWLNLFFPYLDFVYFFVFVPGLFMAVFFQYYAVVGLMSLLLLPLALTVNWVMFYKQRAIFQRNDLHVRKNLLGFTIYLLAYQAIMSPACLAGYFSELFHSRKSW